MNIPETGVILRLLLFPVLYTFSGNILNSYVLLGIYHHALQQTDNLPGVKDEDANGMVV